MSNKAYLYKTLLALSVAGLVVGTWGVVEVLLWGKRATALGSYVTWGMWVALYLFFLGLTAGAFLITILTYVFRIRIFSPIGPLSAFTVLVALACEVLIISFDLGRFAHVYRFFLSPSYTSMITWMVVFTNAMVVIYVLECYFLLRESLTQWSRDNNRPARGFYRLLALGRGAFTEADRLADRRRVHIISLISLPVGLIFYGVNGAIFAILLNRPLWNGALTPLLFIVTALLSGGALIAFLTYLFRIDDELVHYLGQVIRFLLVVFLILELLQFFVGYKTGVVATITSLNIIAFGPYWWVFWFVHLLLGSFIPLYLLVFHRASPAAVACACLLIVITFIAVRLNSVIPDQAVYKLEGLEATFYHARLRTVEYFPNLNEWLVSLWVFCVGMLAFLLGSRWLPLIAAGKGEAEYVR
ncbi:MAG: NrfD/PsrC family molybdoenzyme membrane anchor subunit [Thermodesulfobacteriota bacterium]